MLGRLTSHAVLCACFSLDAIRYFRKERLAILKHTKLLVFFAFGQWFCPVLPL